MVGECHLCGKTSRLVHDHCHTSGLVRGFLCWTCNREARDPEHLRRVLAYVEATPTGPTYLSIQAAKVKRWRKNNPEALRVQRARADAKRKRAA